MKTFLIYHPINGAMNHFCNRGMFEYECVGTVDAISLEHAYYRAQNDFNEDYVKLNKRSTSVGDIIIDNDNKCHMVMGLGFQEVPHTVVSYIDWGNHIEDTFKSIERGELKEQFKQLDNALD